MTTPSGFSGMSMGRVMRVREITLNFLEKLLGPRDFETLMKSESINSLINIGMKIASKEALIPPISEFLPILHACIFDKPDRRAEILANGVKEWGLLQRIWTPNERLVREARKYYGEIKNLSGTEKARLYIYLLYMFLKDGKIHHIHDVMFVLQAALAKDLDEIYFDGLYPSRELPDALKYVARLRLEDIEGMLSRIIDTALAHPSEILVPELSILSVLVYERGLRGADIETLSRLLSNTDILSRIFFEAIAIALSLIHI